MFCHDFVLVFMLDIQGANNQPTEPSGSSNTAVANYNLPWVGFLFFVFLFFCVLPCFGHGSGMFVEKR